MLMIPTLFLLGKVVLCTLSFLPGFSARSLPESAAAAATVFSAGNHSSYNWQNFELLVDTELGGQVSGILELKRYMRRFGYFPSSLADAKLTDTYDELLESAVRRFQKRHGLTATGRLDSATVEQIMAPRCGMRDTHSRLHVRERYAFFMGRPRWARPSPATISYAFSEAHRVPYLDPNDVRAIFRRAFTRWAAVIPVSFVEAEEYRKADVKIGFFRGDHGDGEPFDGVLGVLAHAFSPENGRLHLDAAETWAVDFGSEKSRVAVDLESVATHEIGHILGLAHTPVKEAVMFASLSPRKKKVELTVDDVKGVQALYGSNPNFNISTLAAYETSNHGLDASSGSRGRGLASRLSIGAAVVLLALSST